MNAGKAINWNKLTNEQKEILKLNRSKNMLGKNTGPKPEWVKQKMKKNHADFSGSNHPLYGKKMAESTKEKISNSLKKYYINNPRILNGENNPMYGAGSKYIAFSPQKEKFEIHAGFCEWCRDKGIDPASARRVAQKKQKTAKGWVFHFADQD